jgi:serine/threonine protein kinase
MTSARSGFDLSLDGHEIDEKRAVPAFSNGQILAERYVVERLIGRGGMGEVYLGRHAHLGKRVAIKTLLADVAGPAARQRFEREARVLASLENEHIVTAFDFGCAEDGRRFLVMEYLEGKTLRTLLQAEKTLVAPRAVRLILQTCRGVGAAHSAGALHRDLKPENLFICRRGDRSELCKILDFGLVKLQTGGLTLKTRSGIALGTLNYMSPEQARGESNVDQRSDVYSTAAVLYEALSGKKPHDADSSLALVHKILNEKPQALSELCELPRGLSEVVRKGLAHDPRDRYPSMAALEAALRPYATAVHDTADLTASVGAMNVTPAHASRWRHGWSTGLVALASVAIGLSLGVRTRSADSSRGDHTDARKDAPPATFDAPGVPVRIIGASSSASVAAQPPPVRPSPLLLEQRSPTVSGLSRQVVVVSPGSSAIRSRPSPVPSASAQPTLSFDRESPYGSLP